MERSWRAEFSARVPLALLIASALSLAACNDAARCANYCDHLAECGNVAVPTNCESRCVESLEALDARCGEGVECPCNDAASSYYNCMSFAICSDIGAGAACRDELATANSVCPEPYTPIGSFTTLP